tara:strand:- start:1243 stop:1581 length:339 start_codon:yes stop_codon:yes gene_type:complete
MGAEKRLQRKLNRMGKKKGNTVDVNDGELQITEFIQDHGTKGQKRRATRLYDKINKGKGITMVSPLGFKGANSSNSECWSNKVKVGTKPSPSRPGVTVNDCVDPSSPRAKNK